MFKDDKSPNYYRVREGNIGNNVKYCKLGNICKNLIFANIPECFA